MIFLKLGGSLITDKTRNETVRGEVLTRLARELQRALVTIETPIVVGHGSGSFGHTAAKLYGTRDGVDSADGWRGFAHVSVAAARLNRLVADALHRAGVPVIAVQPSASLRCVDGRIVSLETVPIKQALAHGLCPLVMGDVAWDDVRGGTIVSTEELFSFLANHLPVSRVLLAGETEGVLLTNSHSQTQVGEVHSNQQGDAGAIIARITEANWEAVKTGVGGSRGADVTGGMASKVADMLAMVRAHRGIEVSIFSGLIPDNLERAIAGELLGTTISG